MRRVRVDVHVHDAAARARAGAGAGAGAAGAADAGTACGACPTLLVWESEAIWRWRVERRIVVEPHGAIETSTSVGTSVGSVGTCDATVRIGRARPRSGPGPPDAAAATNADEPIALPSRLSVPAAYVLWKRGLIEFAAPRTLRELRAARLAWSAHAHAHASSASSSPPLACMFQHALVSATVATAVAASPPPARARARGQSPASPSSPTSSSSPTTLSLAPTSTTKRRRIDAPLALPASEAAEAVSEPSTTAPAWIAEVASAWSSSPVAQSNPAHDDPQQQQPVAIGSSSARLSRVSSLSQACRSSIRLPLLVSLPELGERRTPSSDSSSSAFFSPPSLPLREAARCFVYAALHERGYVLTDGRSYGADFALYTTDPRDSHAAALVRLQLVLPSAATTSSSSSSSSSTSSTNVSSLDLVATLRLAAHVNKAFVWAIVQVKKNTSHDPAEHATSDAPAPAPIRADAEEATADDFAAHWPAFVHALTLQPTSSHDSHPLLPSPHVSFSLRFLTLRWPSARSPPPSSPPSSSLSSSSLTPPPSSHIIPSSSSASCTRRQ